jgi:hypothetical protein
MHFMNNPTPTIAVMVTHQKPFSQKMGKLTLKHHEIEKVVLSHS